MGKEDLRDDKSSRTKAMDFSLDDMPRQTKEHFKILPNTRIRIHHQSRSINIIKCLVVNFDSSELIFPSSVLYNRRTLNEIIIIVSHSMAFRSLSLSTDFII